MVKVLELKTTQCLVIKTLFEALKEILIDVNLEFSDKFIRIKQMDIENTILVDLELKTENFEFYECKYTEEEPLVVGINIINLFKLLKTMHNDDILCMSVDDESQDSLELRIENGAKNSVTIYSLGLIDIDEETLNIPEKTFDIVITYVSANFQKIIKDMSVLSKNIKIQSYNKQMILECTGDFASQKTIIGENTDDIKFRINENSIFNGEYETKNLLSFTKCTNLCNHVRLYLKNELPLYIEYAVGNLGKVTLMVGSKY